MSQCNNKQNKYAFKVFNLVEQIVERQEKCLLMANKHINTRVATQQQIHERINEPEFRRWKNSFSAHVTCDFAPYFLQFKSIDYGINKWRENHKFDTDQVNDAVGQIIGAEPHEHQIKHDHKEKNDQRYQVWNARLYKLDPVLFGLGACYGKVDVGPNDEKPVEHINQSSGMGDNVIGQGVGFRAGQFIDDPVHTEEFLNFWAAQVQCGGQKNTKREKAEG